MPFSVLRSSVGGICIQKYYLVFVLSVQTELHYVQMVDTCDIGRTTRILKELPALGIWYTTIMHRASAKANKF